MKRTVLSFLLTMIIVLPFSSCVFIDDDVYGYGFERFDSSLRGTWEDEYGTTVIIDYDTIVIKTNSGNCPQPLNKFTKNSRLKGYSVETDDLHDGEQGLIYIRDVGSWKDPIEYTYWETEDWHRNERLTLKAFPHQLTLHRK